MKILKQKTLNKVLIGFILGAVVILLTSVYFTQSKSVTFLIGCAAYDLPDGCLIGDQYGA